MNVTPDELAMAIYDVENAANKFAKGWPNMNWSFQERRVTRAKAILAAVAKNREKLLAIYGDGQSPQPEKLK